MGKYLLFLFFPIVLAADDLIVDQSALSQYETDDYLLFDVFDVNNEQLWREYVWPHGYYKNTDVVDLTDSAPILGAQFTQEAWIYVDSKTYPLVRQIFRSDSLLWSSPAIQIHSLSSIENIHQIKYGFGDGTDSYINIVSVDLPLKAWHHIATTFDGTNYKLFINGEEIRKA